MKAQILSQFDQPWLPITALIIFVVCFVMFVYWTFKSESKSLYEYTAQLPLREGEIDE